jgi:hypothetical protein
MFGDEDSSTVNAFLNLTKARGVRIALDSAGRARFPLIETKRQRPLT